MRPERPGLYFRVVQKNVVVAAWTIGAASAAFGDIDGDGRPDIVVVTRAGEGSLVKVFLNKGGRFADKPDHEVPLPGLARPSKVRVLPAAKGSRANLWWYPDRTFWRVRARFGERVETLEGGGNRAAAAGFRSRGRE